MKLWFVAFTSTEADDFDRVEAETPEKAAAIIYATHGDNTRIWEISPYTGQLDDDE